ncbi:dehydrogenase/reductase SDR family member 4 isoform X5 [Ochotona curzoniae]|uniref:dehydrogenase/reductase SDR family member 4 isoform X5 n=1 Tax=Ochotona curzoniae TaxID=130825 RepID=UPI001B34F295|nr:dehydrogenase/reductase SDR family member 4 isoform X5 [Ochotona curzoniae]
MQKAQVLLSGCARTWKSVRMASSGATLRNTLANKVAIVTASTDGIGLAIARRLAQDGAHVVISSRKQQNVDRTVAALKQEGLSVSGTVCHVGKAEDRKRLVATFWKDAAQEEQAKQVMRVKRLGNPEECGGIVSFLCSEDASYINGETVVVGGGSPSRL